MTDFVAVAEAAWRLRRVLNLNLPAIVASGDATLTKNIVDALNDINAHLPLTEDGPDWRGPVEHVPDPEQCECGLWSRGLVNGVCADCRDAPMDWTGA